MWIPWVPVPWAFESRIFLSPLWAIFRGFARRGILFRAAGCWQKAKAKEKCIPFRQDTCHYHTHSRQKEERPLCSPNMWRQGRMDHGSWDETEPWVWGCFETPPLVGRGVEKFREKSCKFCPGSGHCPDLSLEPMKNMCAVQRGRKACGR